MRYNKHTKKWEIPTKELEQILGDSPEIEKGGYSVKCKLTEEEQEKVNKIKDIVGCNAVAEYATYSNPSLAEVGARYQEEANRRYMELHSKIAQAAEEKKKPDFLKELTELINKYSLENGSNTSDWILAEYMRDCLEAYNRAVVKRNKVQYKEYEANINHNQD